MVCSTYSNLIDLAGIDTTYTMLQNWIKIDTYGVYKGNYNASKDRKEQRKMREPTLTKKQDTSQHLKSVKYQSHAFYEIRDQGIIGGNGRGKVHGDT